jgi:hypothetical protein
VKKCHFSNAVGNVTKARQIIAFDLRSATTQGLLQPPRKK